MIVQKSVKYPKMWSSFCESVFLSVFFPLRFISVLFIKKLDQPVVKSFIFPLYIFASPLNNTYTQVYLYIYSALK